MLISLSLRFDATMIKWVISKQNKTLHRTGILTFIKSFHNYNHSIKDKLCQTSSSFFQKQLILRPVCSMICLQRLLRTTLFELVCGVYAVDRFRTHRCWTTRACMGFARLYGIYRLALNQSSFLQPGFVSWHIICFCQPSTWSK